MFIFQWQEIAPKTKRVSILSILHETEQQSRPKGKYFIYEIYDRAAIKAAP